MNDAQSGRRAAVARSNFGLMNCGKRAFRTDDEFDEIEFSVPDEFVEVVAADAAHDFRETPIDLLPVGANDIGDAAFQTPAVTASSNFISRRVRPSPEARTTSISRT